LSPIRDTPVDFTRVAIRLPEGATNVHVSTPFPLDSQTTQGPLAKTYLDAVGRPTVVLTKRDCSDQCGQDVLVSLRPLRRHMNLISSRSEHP
jgi:oligosaccharyltransferase complex subunit alpha (ribophorin I)